MGILSRRYLVADLNQDLLNGTDRNRGIERADFLDVASRTAGMSLLDTSGDSGRAQRISEEAGGLYQFK